MKSNKTILLTLPQESLSEGALGAPGLTVDGTRALRFRNLKNPTLETLVRFNLELQLFKKATTTRNAKTCANSGTSRDLKTCLGHTLRNPKVLRTMPQLYLTAMELSGTLKLLKFDKMVTSAI